MIAQRLSPQPDQDYSFGRDQNLFLCFYFQSFVIANLQHCTYRIKAEGRGCLLCGVQFNCMLFDLVIEQWTIWVFFFFLFTKSSNSNPGPPNNGNLKSCFTTCRLSGENNGNGIQTRYKAFRKLIWTHSSLAHLHTFFKQIREKRPGTDNKWLHKIYNRNILLISLSL